jgi:CRISPR system Cascade subunit CasE
MLRMTLGQSELLRLGGRRVFTGRPLDLGYLVHCALKESLGDGAPGVFSIEEGAGRDLGILAYGPLDASVCRERIQLAERGVIRPESVEAKPLPDSFQAGGVYSFRIRACPVIRKARGAGEDAGKERDVYSEASRMTGGKGDSGRERIYGEWLAALFSRTAGCRILSLRLVGFQLTTVLRRRADRTAKDFPRPDATFEGRLVVEDGERLREALRHGLGRHRAFGFGMLLLKRAR